MFPVLSFMLYFTSQCCMLLVHFKVNCCKNSLLILLVIYAKFHNMWKNFEYRLITDSIIKVGSLDCPLHSYTHSQ